VGDRLKETFLNSRNRSSQHVHEKLLNIINHQRNEIITRVGNLAFGTVRMEMEIIMLSQVSQVPHDLAHIWNLKMLLSHKLIIEWWLPEARESRSEEWMVKS
jgi:hypothetical protein